MSNAAYDLQLADAMQDILQQVQVQDAPTTLDTQTNQPIGQKWELPEWFQHYACLYLKYIDIYQKLQEAYDQQLHPQKRIFLKPVLQSSMLRLCQLKQELIKFKSRATSDLVHLDDLLVDLKYDSNILQIPIPRYFRKADTIPVQMTFREEVTDKKKKKGKGKGKKGKKGKAAPEKKEQSDDQKDKLTKEQRLQLLQKKLGEVKQMDNHSIIDFNFFFSIRLIQKSQRGRQYRHRILEIIQWKKTNDRNNQMAVRVAQGEDRSHVTTDQQKQKLAAVYVQKQLRGILARKRVNDLRQEELIFLGMAPRVKSKDQDQQDPIAKMERIKKERRKKQNQHWLEYQIALDDMHQFIKGKQGPDIKEDQLNERRQWIIEETQKNQNQPPDDIKDFYKRNQVEMPLSPEQEEEKKLKEEQQAKAAAAASKKKKDDKGKDKKGGKKKKKGAQEDFDPLKNLVLTGPPELIQKFQQMYQNYADTWENRDESNNFQQKYDSDMVKEDVRPAVEKQLEKQVDAMMAFELEHLKFELGLKKGKKKKGKKKKGKKKKGGKKKKQPPGMKQASKLSPYQLLMQLEQNGIARRYGKQKIKQFIGDFNYLGSMLDNPLEESPDPSMAQIRQNVTEFCVFPLGSQLVKQQSQLIKSVLFYGPSGTGKTMMMRAICHETSSLLLDLSPHTTIGKYTQRKGEQLLVASCFRVAQQYQPAIIYIDQCELVFPTAKKGKGKAKKKKKGGANDPGRIKKALLAYKKTFLNKDLRILIVGCTNNPGQAKTAQLRTFFDKKIYFPYPNYPTRLMMWKNSIQQNGGKVTPQFPLSTLTYISEGYPAGSIEEATKQVLTKYRIQNIDTKPLQIQQFIGPLSLTDYTFIDEYKTFRDFTGDITLDKARITAIKAKDKKGDQDEGGKKDKKAGKKKKK